MKQPTISQNELHIITTSLLRERYEQEMAALIRDVLLEEFSYEEVLDAWHFQHEPWKLHFVRQLLTGTDFSEVDAFIDRVKSIMHRFIERQISKHLEQLEK